MKKVWYILTFAAFCTHAQGQNTRLYNVELGKLVNYSFSFDMGSNYLDAGDLNQELLTLDLLPIDPYTNNFTFQLGADFQLIEIYVNLMLLNSINASETIGRDQIFRYTRFHGNYIGGGIRKQLISTFKKRLSVAASIDFGNAHYFLTLSRSRITNTGIDSLITNSYTILADNNYSMLIQPSVEILYAVMNRKNRFDIGLRLGRFFNIEQEAWRNQHQMVIQGLSPMGNYDTYNFALKFLYTFNRK